MAPAALERTLLDEIAAAPDDDGPRTVYADWLLERGDPRGTFIALQLARARARDAAVSAEEQQLLDAHWRAWVGEPSAVLEPAQVAFERGLWSAVELTGAALPEAALAAGAWSTLRALELRYGADEAQLPALLARTRRSLRVVRVASREALAAVAASGLAIEELVLAFDLSRAPPALAPLAGLPALRTLGVSCLAEFAVRWIERADEAGIGSVVLAIRPHVDYVRKVLRRAKRTRIVRLAIELPAGVVVHADRDAGGTLAIRSLALRPCEVPPPDQLREAASWLAELATHVDPGVKVTMPELAPGLAELADGLGMRLVRHATAFVARPRSQ